MTIKTTNLIHAISFQVRTLEHAADVGHVLVEVRVPGVDVGQLDGHDVLDHGVGRHQPASQQVCYNIDNFLM